MGSIRLSDYLAMLARTNRCQAKAPSSSASFPSCSSEPQLHRQILEHCRARRWLVAHSRMDMPTTQSPGLPDFIILADGGRLLLVEAKSRTGKLRPEQQAFALAASMLGHKVHLVRSLQEFLAIADSADTQSIP